MTTARTYEAYKASIAPWVGAVPAHWDEKPLFAVARHQHQLRARQAAQRL